MKSRFLISVGGALALLVGAVLVPASPASASVLDIACAPPSSGITTFDPALTMARRAVDVSSTLQYGPCVSPTDPDIISGSAVRQDSGEERSCLELFNPGTVTYTITWNTGETSVITGNTTSTMVAGLVVTTVTGTVVEGVFAGSNVVEVLTAVSSDLLLCTLGLRSVSRIASTLVLKIGRV